MLPARSPAPAGGPPAGLRLSVAASLAGKGLELVTLVALATVVPRALGPASYGRFALALTVVTVASLALTLGGPTLMARYVAAAPPGERTSLARTLGARLARGRALPLALLALASVAAVLVAGDRLPPLEVGLLFAALVLNVAATLALQVVLGLGRTGAWSLRYPVQNAVVIVAVLVLEPALGVLGGVVAILAGALVAAALGAAVVRPVLVAPGAPRVALPAGAIRFGALQAAGAALVQLCHRGGVLAVALLGAGAAETGFAALAGGVALGVTYAVLQTFTVSLPHLAAGDGSSAADPASRERVLRRLAGLFLAPLGAGTLLAAATLDRVVPAVFGPGYAEAAAAFGPALAVVVLAPLGALAVQAAALRFRPEAALRSGIASAVAFVAAAAALVPIWGAAGGTAATLAGASAGAVVSIRSLPGVVGARLAAASFAGAGAVLATAVLG